MRLCLDTNAYSDWVRSRFWVDKVATAEAVLIPTIVLGELREGFMGGSRMKQNEAVLGEILSSRLVDVLDVTNEISSCYAELKQFLKKRGNPIPVNDIWIAASCLVHQATLLTRDKHFKHLPQISVLFAE